MITLFMSAAALAVQGGDVQSSPPTPDARSVERQTLEVIPGAGTPGRTTEVLSGGNADLEINEKKSELTLGYTFITRSQTVTGAAGDQLALMRQTFDVELSLPLGGADNLLSRETFDGLADGPTLTLSYTWFGTRSRDPFTPDNRAFAAIIERAYRNCIAKLVGPELTAAQCQTRRDLPTRAFALEYSGMAPAQINRTLLNPGYAAGIEGSIGLDRYNYRTPLTLAEHRVTEPQFAITAFGSLFPADGVSVATLSVGYESSYEALDSEILCRPVVADPNDDCVSAAPGAPRHVETLPIAFEYRRAFAPIRGFGRFAIAPRIAFDALSNEFEAELPIYLAFKGFDSILPGLTISYDSRHDEVVFGLFLRTRFSFGG